MLRKALVEGAHLTDRNARPGVLLEAETLVTRAHTDMIDAFVAEQNISLAGVDVIGFHGQTVLHRPCARLTVQLGEGTRPGQAAGVRRFDVNTGQFAGSMMTVLPAGTQIGITDQFWPRDPLRLVQIAFIAVGPLPGRINLQAFAEPPAVGYVAEVTLTR